MKRIRRFLAILLSVCLVAAPMCSALSEGGAQEILVEESVLTEIETSESEASSEPTAPAEPPAETESTEGGDGSGETDGTGSGEEGTTPPDGEPVDPNAAGDLTGGSGSGTDDAGSTGSDLTGRGDQVENPSAGTDPEADADASDPGEGADPEAIDYTQSAAASPAFCQGYAELKPDTVAYAESGTGAQALGTIGGGVVYVLGRESSGQADRLNVAFDWEGVRYAWVDAGCARPMTQDEVANFVIASAGREGAVFLPDSPELPLDKLECVPAGADSAGEAAEGGAEPNGDAEVVAPSAKLVVPQASFTLGVGQTCAIGASFDDGNSYLIKYTPDNKEIADVSQEGVITALAVGETTVKLHCDFDDAEVHVTVKAAPTGLTLTAPRTELGVNDVVQLDAALPEGEECALTFTTSDTSVATVNETGLVTTYAAGTVTITVKTYNELSASVTLTVLPAPESIALNLKELTLGVGQKAQLLATVSPANAAPACTFRAEPEGIVQIDPVTGALEAKASGVATVTVETYNKKSATCRVTVNYAPKGVAFAESEITVGINEYVNVPLNFTAPDGAEEGAVCTADCTYSSSNAGIAYVDDQGNIWAGKVGTAYITATTDNHLTATLKVTVMKAPSKVYIDAPRNVLGVGETMDVWSWPSDGAAARKLTFSSSNESVLKVVDNAARRVQAVGKGIATLSVCTYNDKWASMNIVVLDAPKSIALNLPEGGEIGVGQPLKVTATVPKDTMGTYTFSSDNAAIIEVDANTGALNAKAAGTANITVTAYNGVKDTKAIKVVPAPDSITLSETNISMGVDEWALLPEIIATENTKATYYYWSMNPGIVEVNEYGWLWARKAGTAVISVGTHNGKYAELTVTVQKAPKAVYIDAPSSVLGVGETMDVWSWVSAGAVSRRLDFSSSNESVLKVVDNAGRKVQAVGKGTATLSVCTFNNKWASMNITVLDAPKSITLNLPEGGEIAEAQPLKVTAKVPDGMAGSYTFSSDNTAIIEVDANTGALNAKEEGTANITVTAYNGVKDTKKITVVPAPDSITLSETNISMGVDEWAQLPKITPNRGRAVYYYWSSNSRIVEVNEQGWLWARKAGTAVISVGTHNGKYAELTVTVQKAPKAVYIDAPSSVLGVGETMDVWSWVSAGAVSRRLDFSSSNESVLKVVDNAGRKVQAVGKGTATLSVCTFNNKWASMNITVLDAPKSIALNLPEGGEIAEAQPLKVTAKVPDGMAGSYTFSSDNTAIIEVDANTGALNAKEEGTANITVTAYNGVKDTKEITVVPAPDSITLSETNISMGVDEWAQLPKITPNRGRAVYYYWSSNSRIVEVNEQGWLWARKAGTAVISVGTHNGKYAELTVTVQKAPKAVYIDAPRNVLGVGETMDVWSWVSAGAVSRRLDFSSSDESVLKVVDNAGRKVQAVGEGHATLSVCTFNNKWASMDIWVVNAPERATLPETLTLGRDEWYYTFAATLSPEGSSSKLTYSIDDANIATIDPDTGAIHALAAGETTVRVETYNKCASTTCRLTVKNAPEGIQLQETYLELSVGDSYQLKPPSLLGEDVYCTTVGYWSSKPNNVSVSSTGLVTALKKGDAYVSVGTYNNKVSSIYVSVIAAPKAISFTEAEHRLFLNRKYTPDLWFENGIPCSYKLYSSDETIVRVCEDGKTVESLKPGTVTLTAETYNYQYAWLQVKVPELPGSVKLEPASLTLGVGEKATLRAVVPEGTGAEMTFTSDNTGIASFEAVNNETVTVTGAGVGDTVIHVKSQNGKESAANVKVFKAPTALSLTPGRADRCIDEKSLQLSWNFGEAGEGGRVDFASDNPSVATVNASGLVTFVGTGAVRITATTYNGHEASCDLNVGERPGKIFFEQASYKVALGDRVRIPASFDKGCESYTFTASGDCVTVSGDAVYGASLGKATLTAKSHFGLTATCEVEVVNAPNGIKADIEEVIELVIGIGATQQLKAIPLLDGEPSVGSVHYATSNPAVAVVDYETGLVSPKDKGECEIIATTYNGFSTKYSVKVSYLLEGAKIGIDPGHQAVGDMGRESRSPSGGGTKYRCAYSGSGVAHVSEHVINLQVSLKLRDELEKLGAEVYMTRETADVNISNRERALLLNDKGVDFALRIHCNAADVSSANGLSIYRRATWAYSGPVQVGGKMVNVDGGWVRSEEHRLCQKIANAFVGATGCNWRGENTTDEYTMNNWSAVPCLLVELGFMTNPTEGRLLVDPDYQQKMVLGIVDGICSYYGKW